MKLTLAKLFLAATGGFGAVLVLSLTGCRSAGYTKSDAAASRLQRAAFEVRGEISLLDGTIASLNDLLNKASGDLRLPFRRFSDALDQLAAANRRAVGEVSGLRKSGAAYFDAWDKEILRMNDEKIHQNSSARKSDTVEQFDAALREYADAQNALLPVINYLKDIRTALSADLTMGGLQAAKEPAKSAADNAGKAKDRLSRSANTLDALSEKMSFFAPEKTK